MGFILFVLFLASVLPVVLSEEAAAASAASSSSSSSAAAADATFTVNGIVSVAEIDDNFICATMDWWPPDKCDYHQCPWGNSSLLNVDLTHPLLTKAIQAFRNLRLRIGGSLQDQVLYDVESLKSPCHPFRKMKDGLFGFSHGCLPMNRWDELNQFFIQTRAIVTFSLNALYGRHKSKKSVWEGVWDYSNARDFINYTISKGYIIDSWEFGNELSGAGVGASVSANLYGKDAMNLKNMINSLYQNSFPKPSILAPGGFFDENWFAQLLQFSGPGVINTISHHIYNLGAGVDSNLMKKILDPEYLNRVSGTFREMMHIVREIGPWASIWVGESGGAYNSGGSNVSDTFVNSFWYLDQLGMASKYNTKVYCRQTLLGGNYGLLNKATFTPNPDYYSALLWHRLMGKGVLDVASNASPFLRTYAHCSKGKAGVTLLLINLSNQTDFTIHVQNVTNIRLQVKEKMKRANSISSDTGHRKLVARNANQANGGSSSREEYHLTAKDGHLQSKTMLLNGIPLLISSDHNIPELNPAHVRPECPIWVNALSISFIVFPNFNAPTCANPLR